MTRQMWVLGILFLNYQPPRPIFVVVPDRRATTLVPIIQRYVAPGSTITTDGWRSYRSLGGTYIHRVVNHSLNFVDPVTGASPCVYFHGPSECDVIPSRLSYSSYTAIISSSGAHTNAIEGAWSHAKKFVKACARISTEEELKRELSVYMWQKWCGQTYPGGAVVRILRDISVEFPLNI